MRLRGSVCLGPPASVVSLKQGPHETTPCPAETFKADTNACSRRDTGPHGKDARLLDNR